MKKSWNFSENSIEHTIDIEHNIITGRKSIFVDNSLILEKGFNIFESRNIKLPFQIGNHNCMVLIRLVGFKYLYDFFVDGFSVDKNISLEKVEDKVTIRQFLSVLSYIGFMTIGVIFTTDFIHKKSPFLTLISILGYLLLFYVILIIRNI